MSYKVIEKWKSHKACLTNHTGSILCHITPQDINALGADTHTHTHTHVRMHTHTHTHTHTYTIAQLMLWGRNTYRHIHRPQTNVGTKMISGVWATDLHTWFKKYILLSLLFVADRSHNIMFHIYTYLWEVTFLCLLLVDNDIIIKYILMVYRCLLTTALF